MNYYNGRKSYDSQMYNKCPDNKCNYNMDYDDKCFDNKPLAIAYVPWQKWKNVMCAKEGMEHGTIFAELVMPFKGCQCKGRG